MKTKVMKKTVEISFSGKKSLFLQKITLRDATTSYSLL